MVALISSSSCAEGYSSPSPQQSLKSHCRARLGNFAGKYRRLFFRFVVVGNHVDSFFVEVFHQLHRSMCQAGFGITHGSWWIAVDRSEVPCPSTRRVAHRPSLRHTHKRRIDHLFAVRMVIPGRIAGDFSAFTVLAARAISSAAAWRREYAVAKASGHRGHRQGRAR